MVEVAVHDGRLREHDVLGVTEHAAERLVESVRKRPQLGECSS